MTILSKILKKKKEPVAISKSIPVILKYPPAWLDKMSSQNDYIVIEANKYDILVEMEFDGHCSETTETCPCNNMKYNGICKRGLFENRTNINPIGNTTKAVIK